jgi:hypothetical protein
MGALNRAWGKFLGTQVQDCPVQLVEVETFQAFHRCYTVYNSVLPVNLPRVRGQGVPAVSTADRGMGRTECGASRHDF